MIPLDLLRLNSTIFKLTGVELDSVGLTRVELDFFGLLVLSPTHYGSASAELD